MVELSVEDVDAGALGVDLELLLADAQALLQAAKAPDAELSLLLTSDEGIHALNAIWRGKPEPTDVLSFAQHEGDERGGQAEVLGDLVVSLPTAQRQAGERDYGLHDELRVLLVHGLLHLFGYEHEGGGAGLVEMAAAERTLLDRLGWAGVGLIAAAEQRVTVAAPKPESLP